MIISQSIEEAKEILRKGGAVVYPTDTVLGLGVDATNESALRNLYRIKNRPLDKPVPIIVANLNQAKKIALIKPQQEAMLNSLWPGAVTVVLRAKAGGTIALRIPDHPVPQELAQEFPITGTSANISGEPPCIYIHEVQNQFYGHEPQPDLILDIYTATNKKEPSTIIDLTVDRPRILRVGACRPADLMKILRT